MKKNYIYVCKTKLAFNRLRAIAQRKVKEGIKYNLKGSHSLICNQRIDEKVRTNDDFNCFLAEEKQDNFGNIYYGNIVKIF